jgi:hypothetical protein
MLLADWKSLKQKQRTTEQKGNRHLCLWQQTRKRTENKTKSESEKLKQSPNRGGGGRRGRRKRNRVGQGGRREREEGRYGESNGGGDRKRYEVKKEIHKGKAWQRGVGKPKTPRPTPQSMTFIPDIIYTGEKLPAVQVEQVEDDVAPVLAE